MGQWGGAKLNGFDVGTEGLRPAYGEQKVCKIDRLNRAFLLYKMTITAWETEPAF